MERKYAYLVTFTDYTHGAESSVDCVFTDEERADLYCKTRSLPKFEEIYSYKKVVLVDG